MAISPDILFFLFGLAGIVSAGLIGFALR